MRMSLDVGMKTFGSGHKMTEYTMSVVRSEIYLPVSPGAANKNGSITIWFESNSKTELSAGNIHIPLELARNLFFALQDLLINNEHEKRFIVHEDYNDITNCTISCTEITEEHWHKKRLSESKRRKEVKI